MGAEVHAGHAVHVVRHGPRGARPDLMLIHCGLASHHALLPLLEELSPDRAAVLFDMPGHGRSAAWGGEGDFQGETAAIAASLLAGGPAHVIGHSYGATVALRLALDHPDRVTRLSLIEPVLFAAVRGSAAWHAHRQRQAGFEDAMISGDAARAAREFHGIWGQGAWHDIPAAVQRALAGQIHIIGATEPGIEDDIGDMLAPGRLEALTCPVDLIRGADSPPVIAAIHAKLATRLADTTESVIGGAGHMVPVTHPRAVARAIKTR